MKQRTNSPFQLILFILVLSNVIIIRDGFLLGSELYLALFGTVPLTVYAAFRTFSTGRRTGLYSD